MAFPASREGELVAPTSARMSLGGKRQLPRGLVRKALGSGPFAPNSAQRSTVATDTRMIWATSCVVRSLFAFNPSSAFIMVAQYRASGAGSQERVLIVENFCMDSACGGVEREQCAAMRNVPEPLRVMLDRAGLTQYQLAEQVGVSQAAVSRHLNGWVRATHQQRVKYALALGVSVEEFEAALGLGDTRTSRYQSNPPKSGRVFLTNRRIPLVSSVSAGPRGDYMEWGSTSQDALEFLDDGGVDHPDQCFACRVHGTSMEPTLYDGDFIICRRLDPYAGHPPIADECCVVVRFTEEASKSQAALGRWVSLPDGRVRLKKDNPLFSPTDWDRSAFAQVAVVVQRRTSRL